MWNTSLSVGINVASSNRGVLKTRGPSYQLIQLHSSVLRRRVSSHHNSPVWSLGSLQLLFIQHCFPVCDMRVLQTEGCQLRDIVILLGSEDTVSSPAFTGPEELVLSLSVCMLLPEKSVKPIEGRVSPDIADNHYTTSSFQLNISFTKSKT